LRRLCEKYIPNHYLIEEVDIKAAGAHASNAILVFPTVERTFPLPKRRIVGDISNVLAAAEGLGLLAAAQCNDTP
jgi:circadian clock protein KaiB